MQYRHFVYIGAEEALLPPGQLRFHSDLSTGNHRDPTRITPQTQQHHPATHPLPQSIGPTPREQQGDG
jgi:hypothetical protein